MGLDRKRHAWMKLLADEKNLPRLHLIGTLAIAFLLILLLSGLFALQGHQVHRAALHNIEIAAQQQVQARLESEMESVLGVIDFTRERAESGLRRSLMDQVDAAYGVAQGIYERERGRRPDSEIQRLIVAALRPARFFDGRGYVFIDDMQGHIRLLPPNPELEGKLQLDNRDDRGRPIMGSLIEAARQPRGEGWARYRWYMLENPREMSDKLSYVRHFAPYDWIIGVGDYLHYWDDKQRSEALDRLRATRFGRTGHIGVTRMQGPALLIPTAPELEGKPLETLPAHEAEAVASVARLAQQGGGYLSYDWPDPGSGELRRKTALVRPYQPWGWVLVVTMLDDELTAPVQKELEQQQLVGRDQALMLLAVLALASLLAVSGSIWFSRWLGRLFSDYARRNLEQQQALRQSEEKLSTILDSVDASIFIKDPEFRYRYVNRQACQTMGQRADDILGRDDHDLLDPERARQARATDLRVLTLGERVTTEWTGELSDGRQVVLSTVKLPLRDAGGRIYALCGVSADITESKRVEQVLAQARDAAEAANRAKSDFLSNVSHELCTPLNSILGMLHLVFATELSQQQRGHLQQVHQAARQLHDIIVDMLDYAQLENGRLQMQNLVFRLDELLDQLGARQSPLAVAKGLEFSMNVAAEVPLQLVGDPRRLRQVLQQYLDNALKFTLKGSVALQVSLLRRDAQAVLLHFEVSDTGIGVAEDMRERLFRHIAQGDATSTRAHGGAGIGLVLVRQLATLMGGEVGFESQPGRGSVFRFTALLGCLGGQLEHQQGKSYRWPHALVVEPEHSPQAPDEGSGAVPWQDLRERLLGLLRDDDVDSLELFEQHQHRFSAALGERHAEFAQLMRSYDFPAALELLEQGD
jgi:PAS domain S-box-containing protein